jgi:hypothetical protein
MPDLPPPPPPLHPTAPHPPHPPQVIALCEKPRDPPLKYIVADTPGQIEIFTWSASGQLVTELFASGFPTVVAYVVDTPRWVGGRVGTRARAPPGALATPPPAQQVLTSAARPSQRRPSHPGAPPPRPSCPICCRP